MVRPTPSHRGVPSPLTHTTAHTTARTHHRTRHNNDRSHRFESRIYPGADGGVTIYSVDITARKKSEERLSLLAKVSPPATRLCGGPHTRK
jgi:hypothetical protein